ncbi:ecotin family protein [Escherichia coli DEC11D]|nr:ecotin family protein [Escherichia coli DEC11D]
MKTILPAVLFAAFTTTSAWAAESVQPLEKIAPYPQAEKGMKRQVIQLTPQEDESTLKVELLIGQTLEVDCNLHRLGGKLETKRWKAGAMIIMSLIKLARRFPR